MRYTLEQFRKEYPDDAACLVAVLENRYGNTCPKCGVVGTKFYPITGRKAFSCSNCRQHVYPLADTIFRKSETSLWNWFYAIFQFSVSKNGVSAKELQRTLGVTYKTAWRMCRQIRLLMAEEIGPLGGTVETDETYIGGYRKKGQGFRDKEAVFGIVERGGRVKAEQVSGTGYRVLMPRLIDSVTPGSTVYTDQAGVYRKVARFGYLHDTVNHRMSEYGRGLTHTNTIEGFWSQLKRSIDGTYHAVSPKHLQHYVDEFAFRYNHRTEPIGPILLRRAVKRV